MKIYISSLVSYIYTTYKYISPFSNVFKSWKWLLCSPKSSTTIVSPPRCRKLALKLSKACFNTSKQDELQGGFWFVVMTQFAWSISAHWMHILAEAPPTSLVHWPIRIIHQPPHCKITLLSYYCNWVLCVWIFDTSGRD